MSRNERHKLICSVYLILMNGDDVLLSRRFNTGYEDGKYSFIAGHVEAGESATQALIREAKEEAGIVLKPEDVTMCHVMHRKSDDERLDIFYSSTTWQGEPRILEPNKCDALDWVPLTSLPDNTIPYIRSIFEYMARGTIYSEVGW